LIELTNDILETMMAVQTTEATEKCKQKIMFVKHFPAHFNTL
jgi:hypothetical protein